MTFSYKKMALKGLKYFVIFLLPFVIKLFNDQFPDVAALTLGGLLTMGYNFLKIKLEVVK